MSTNSAWLVKVLSTTIRNHQFNRDSTDNTHISHAWVNQYKQVGWNHKLINLHESIMSTIYTTARFNECFEIETAPIKCSVWRIGFGQLNDISESVFFLAHASVHKSTKSKANFISMIPWRHDHTPLEAILYIAKSVTIITMHKLVSIMSKLYNHWTLQHVNWSINLWFHAGRFSTIFILYHFTC